MNPSCLLHPNEQFTIFCPSCLFQRLSTLDPTTTPAATTTTSAAAAIKSIFTKSSNNKGGGGGALLPPKPTKSSAFFPHLVIHFTLEKNCQNFTTASATSAAAGASSLSLSQTHLISKDSINVFEGSGKIDDLELKEEISGESEEEFEDCEIGESNFNEIGEIQEAKVSCSEIVEEEEVINDYITVKPMKEFLDVDWQSKKTTSGGMKEIAGSFRSAASVFSKKWHNWRRKQKVKKEENGGNSATLNVEKGLSRRYRESRFEVGDGVVRRSCDVDPRFSLDAGRISFDDPRCSFEQPRASWDGHLIGRSFPKMNPMDSLVEDAPVVHIPVVDNGIIVDEQGKVNFITEDDNVPGGSAQTRNYYADSSTRRRKSLDRSSSIRKTAASVVAEIDEMKAVSNAKVSPATIENLHGAKVLVGEGVLKESNSSSSINECSETFGVGNFRGNASVIGNEERKGTKKSGWSWKLWTFINKRKDDDVRYSKTNGVERSLSESCQELRRNSNVELRESLNRKMFRSNSSASRRNSPKFEAAFGNVNRPENETKDLGRKWRGGFVLERNRSGRYCINNIDNGLLRFYPTPMRSSQRVSVEIVASSYNPVIMYSEPSLNLVTKMD
ncbi:hypothetical protein Leryth_011646 [Lithospermum erythrorhizon]|nr:hypothetical protein Leryth_011646 [Lithospermum erythrorhizon]